MSTDPVASFYHAETTDLDRCTEIAKTAQAIVSGLKVDCFFSQNGSQVVFHLEHPNTLARSSAIMLIKQFLHHDFDQAAQEAYENLRVIAFANEKGGVAKTTSCLNLAACLAMRRKQVLLIDLDAQSNATLGLGFSPAQLAHHPEELLTNPMFPLQRAILSTEIPHLDLVPASPAFHEADLALVSAVGRELKLRAKLLAYLRRPDAKRYDYVMIDSPPAADMLTLNVLMAATHLIVPVQATYYSLTAMGRLSATLDTLYEALDPRVQLLGILVTMYNGLIPAQRALLEVLREKITREFGPFVFSTTIEHSESMNESEASQRPIVLTHPTSAAAEAYHRVAEEILWRVEGEGLTAASAGEEALFFRAAR